MSNIPHSLAARQLIGDKGHKADVFGVMHTIFLNCKNSFDRDF